MLTLTIRTDKPEAEIGLYDDGHQIAYHIWTAHRQLAESLHSTLRDMLAEQNYSFQDLGGLVYYAGTGSFTGLRIGASVANAIAYARQIPIVATTGSDWIIDALQKLPDQPLDNYIVPEYGGEAHITQPKDINKNKHR